MRRTRFPEVLTLAAVLLLAGAGVAQPGGASAGQGPAVSASGPAESAASQPASAAPRKPSSVSRIAANFATLMGNCWADIGWFAGKCVLNAILWASGMLLAGVALGVGLFLLLRRRRLFDAPWGWYRYVRWVWGVVFILCVIVGMTCAGGWIGLERQLKHAILKERVLDRTAGNLVLAVFMDSAEYRASGEESAENLQAVLKDSESAARSAIANLPQIVDEIAGPELSATQRRALRLMSPDDVQKLFANVGKLDMRMVIVLFYGSANIEQVLQEHPQANPAVMAIAVHFESLRQRGCRLVNRFTRPPIYMWLFGGLGIPLGLLAIFRVVVRCVCGPSGRQSQFGT